jgi:3-phosphoshikimate 1-carboxyvinyltransferase
LKTLYLYGPPASGKSHLARKLAKDFACSCADLDREIVRRDGRTIPEIFAAEGEAGFRAIESATLRDVKADVVALGGGTLLDPANRAFCEANGFVAVIEADPEVIARRIAAAKGTRPLGNTLEERKAHYASFPHRIDSDTQVLLPRLLCGKITVPPSKSHLHRILIAEYLAGVREFPATAGDCADIAATKRCLSRLSDCPASQLPDLSLDVGESGSTLRFLVPVTAALGLKPNWIRRGRLGERPMIDYDGLKSGLHELPGNVSSQFVTGLLFALPLLDGDSEIRFTSPLQSRGYVDMTLKVVRAYGVRIGEDEDGFKVPGGQLFVRPKDGLAVEGDWSASAFWFAANALGSRIEIEGLVADSAQPDRVVEKLLSSAGEVDVSPCPDLYPALRAAMPDAKFVGTERLRIKESDRIAAMDELLANPSDVDSKNDHRIAMAAAVLSTVAEGPTLVHGASCVAKSYPDFWDEFGKELYAVTGWPIAYTRSPEIHNAAFAAEGRRAQMVAFPSETIAGAMDFAHRFGVSGMAVTIPHKLTVMPLLDAIDPDARDIGAVNTVAFRNGRKVGYNTDARGFLNALRAFCPDGIPAKAAVLGDGGAAKAVRRALEIAGIAHEVFHRRPLTPGFGLVVNCTPADPIPEYAFAGSEAVYDLRYDPEETPLMARARAAGCRVSNGFSMLVEQARLQREIWYGR